MALTLLFALMAVALAVPRINISNKGPFTLQKGFSMNVTFTLDEPIICADPQAYCAVVVLLTNTDTKSVQLNTCQVKWVASNWWTPVTVLITASETFIDDGQKMVTIITNPAISGSEYYSSFSAGNITLMTMSRPTKTCSATGDPHYTTFDGLYYNFMPDGQYVLVKSTVREFEVQSRLYHYPTWQPALHCGVAAREGNDVVYINLCPGVTPGVTVAFTSPPALQPKVAVSGSTYQITFQSGAFVQVQDGGVYYNVYVTVPGIDYNHTVGMCGNNNGIQSDDANIAYGGTFLLNQANLLFPDQQVTAANDLWAFKPSTVSTTVAPPPFEEECPYTAPVVNVPIIANGDAVDITEVLKAASNVAAPVPLSQIQFDDTYIPGTTDKPFNITDAQVKCNNALLTSSLGKYCSTLPGLNVQIYVDNCVIDLQLGFGNPMFTRDAVVALQTACAAIAGSDVSTWVTDPTTGLLVPNPMLTDMLCPNSCYNNGVCKSGTCICNPGFSNVDCSHNLNAPPTVASASPFGCDNQDPRGCPTIISISGSNFYNANGTTGACKFGSTQTALTYVSPSIVQCVLPSISSDRTDLFTLPVSVSNDGVTFSSQAVNFVWYDSVCDICDAFGVCTVNPNSCVINGSCYSSLDVNPANPCQICNATSSKSSWSYSFANGYSCSPVFDQMQYHLSLTMTPANQSVATVHAGNNFFTNDNAYAVVYSLAAGSNTQLFQINPVTGVISTKQLVDPNQIDLSTFNALLSLVATDQGGNTGQASLYIQFQGSDVPPVFDNSSYVFTVYEDVANGTVVGHVHATDANANQNLTSVNLGWGIFTYGWILQEANFGGVFAVDPNTGVVTTALPIVYSRKASYYLLVRAIDGGGQFSTANVTINVIRVNHAPTNITLSSNTIPAENDTIAVGTLSAVDADVGDTFTYTIVSANVPFTIRGDTLFPTQKLNFQQGPDSYVLNIRATAQTNLSVVVPITVYVLEVNLPPYNTTMSPIVSSVNISGTTIRIPGNFLVESAFASVAASDPNVGQIVTCTAMGSSTFVISNNQVILAAPLNFLTTPTQTFQVVCADNGMPSLYTTPLTFTVIAVEVNVGGQEITLLQSPKPLPENSTIGSSVGYVSALDPNSDATTLTFSTATTDHFEFSGTPVCVAYGLTGAKQCQAQLVVRSGLSFELYPNDVVHVTTVDRHGLATTATVSVVISNSPTAPTGIALSSNRVTQGVPNGFIVASVQVIASVQPSTPSYTVTLTDSSSGRFQLVSNSNSRRDTFGTNYSVAVADTTRINHIATPQLSINLTVSDGQFTETFTVVLTVDPRIIVPLMPAVSISQDSPVGFKVATVSLEYFNDYPSGLVPQFSLSGANSGLFSITADTVTPTASIVLLQSLANFNDPTLTFTVVVSFGGSSVSPVQQTFTLNVTKVHAPPVFGSYPLVYVRKDISEQTVLITVQAQNPSGSPVTYSIVSSFANFLSIDTNTGDVSANFAPSSDPDTPLGTYTAVIGATDGIASAQVTITFQIIDNCFVIGSDPVPCAPNGVCVDGTASYSCACNYPFSGPDCQDTQLIGGGNALGSSLQGGSIAGIVVGCLVGLVLVMFLVLIVLRRRRTARKPLTEVDAEGQAEVFNNGFITEAVYDAPNHPEAELEPGLSNPMYAWYQPQMSRQECEEYLATRGEGAFVIRDSSFTPGWHMLGVKTANAIVHERIKLNQDGTYELVPSTGAHQPNFRVLPELVDHYAAVKRQGLGFSLAVDNPIYDNHLLQAAPRAAASIDMAVDADAPALPSHYDRAWDSATA